MLMLIPSRLTTYRPRKPVHPKTVAMWPLEVELDKTSQHSVQTIANMVNVKSMSYIPTTSTLSSEGLSSLLSKHKIVEVSL